jgi:hypothetical protein
VVAHRVASRLREDRDRAWAEARQLRAEAAHLEQQWRHDFMEVQLGLKMPRSFFAVMLIMQGRCKMN